MFRFLGRDGDDEKGQGCYLVTAFFAALAVLLWEWLWPDVIPFTVFEFWTWKGTLQSLFMTSWPLLLWGVGVSTFLAFLDDKGKEMERDAEMFLIGGGAISVWAGVVEEICFRWLIFYSEIIGFKLFNVLFCGLLSWTYLYIFGPVANACTFGYLEPWLLGNLSWAVGAAIISSNGKFRDGHQYQGLLGWINSWFFGMYCFYLMFKFGLPAAILIHFLYDMLIFIVHYVDAVIGRARNKDEAVQ